MCESRSPAQNMCPSLSKTFPVAVRNRETRKRMSRTSKERKTVPGWKSWLSKKVRSEAWLGRQPPAKTPDLLSSSWHVPLAVAMVHVPRFPPRELLSNFNPGSRVPLAQGIGSWSLQPRPEPVCTRRGQAAAASGKRMRVTGPELGVSISHRCPMLKDSGTGSPAAPGSLGGLPGGRGFGSGP